MAGAGELLDRALGIGAFADVLEEGGGDLVAEMLLDRQAAHLMLPAPAHVAARADVNETDLQWIIAAGSLRHGSGGDRHRGCGNDETSHGIHSCFTGPARTQDRVRRARPSRQYRAFVRSE